MPALHPKLDTRQKKKDGSSSDPSLLYKQSICFDLLSFGDRVKIIEPDLLLLLAEESDMRDKRDRRRVAGSKELVDALAYKGGPAHRSTERGGGELCQNRAARGFESMTV